MISIKNRTESARMIRELREKAGISIEDMASKCGIDNVGISVDEYEAIENGSNRDLMNQNVAYICARLQISMNEIGVECFEAGDIDDIDTQERN